jgi:peptide/nickel transport system permease protein
MAVQTRPLDLGPRDGARRTGYARAWHSLLRAGWPAAALAVVLLVVALALFGPAIAPKDPNRQRLSDRLTPPFQYDAVGHLEFLLGTDGLGRDVLSRLIYGARVSMFVGLTAVGIGGLLGTVLGLVAGYFGGLTDDLIMRLADVQLAFPFILLLIMFLVVLEQSVVNLVLVLGVAQWVTYARVARGQTLSEREKEYVLAARAVGVHTSRIMSRHILPNILSALLIIASSNIVGVILSEAALSFLGLGVPRSVPTWGAMLADSRDQILAGHWWLAVYPGLAILVTALAFNLLGDWLRDYLDPRLRD